MEAATSQQRKGRYEQSTPPRLGVWLQYWLYAIPFLLVAVCVVGWVGDSFRRIGNDLQLEAPASESPAMTQPSAVAADPWNPAEALAPYARTLWLFFATGVSVVILIALAVALSRILPEKRYRPSAGERGVLSEPKDVFVKRQHLLRVLENDVNALFEGRVEVRHVMTRSPVTISPDESLDAACELMEAKNVHHLAVCNDEGLLIGMLSLHYARRCDARTVGKAMLTDPVSVPPDALLNPTVTQMIAAGVSCVAVVAEGYCVGILTTADVQLTLQCALALLFKVTNDESERGESDPPAGSADESARLDDVLAAVGVDE